MSTLAGFVLGYVIGAKHGPEGFAKLQKAWETLIGAPEVKALIERAPKLSDVFAQDGNGVAGQLQALVGGNEHLQAAWRAIAQSAAFETIVGGGLSFARVALERGLGLIAQR